VLLRELKAGTFDLALTTELGKGGESDFLVRAEARGSDQGQRVLSERSLVKP